MERSYDDKLFDQYLLAKSSNPHVVVFPRCALDVGDFQLLVTYDIESDRLCGMSQKDGVAILICMDPLGHDGAHFGLAIEHDFPTHLDPPSLAD